MRQLFYFITVAMCAYGCASETSSAEQPSVPVGDYITTSTTGASCVADSDCDDENPCTQDLCRETDGCGYVGLVAACEDGDPCSVGETCQGGECLGGVDACGCRADEDCLALDDGDMCNGVLTCNTASVPYLCEFDAASVVVCEGDDGSCMESVCDPASGICVQTQAPDGSACDDGDGCSAVASCVDGVCVGGPALGCADRECGLSSDGCSCGDCGEDAACSPEGLCIEGVCVGDPPPGCADRECGLSNDGCSCGDCGEDAACSPEGLCVEVAPSGIACFSAGIELVAPTPLPAALSVGGFEVVVTDDELVVRHEDEPARDLFAPPSGGGWLHMAKAHLHAEEHQGSFELEEEIFVRCEQPMIENVYQQDGALLVVGGFADDTPECADASWETRMCEAGAHRLTLDIAAEDPYFDLIILRADSSADEHIWGAGVQSPHDTLDLKGRSLPIIAQEGGLGRGHAIITPAVNQFSKGSGGSEDSTYVASAHYLTSEARSLFLENTETAFFDFTADEAIELRLYSTGMTAQVIHGTEPLELIERFTDWAGRMVAPPAWANQGAIVALARPLEDSLGHVDDLLDAGAALAAVWNQTWSGTATTYIGEQVLWNWVLNETAHPGWHDWADELDDRGLRVLCYVNTMFRELPEEVLPVKRDLYQEGIEGGYFVHDEEGLVLKFPVTAFDVALLDFTNDEARTWMKDIIKEEMIDYAGCSGWMADFAEALPFEAVMSDGTKGDEWHNRYPVEWAALNREALAEADKLDDVLVFNRSGHTRTPGAALAMWQGDQLVTWDKYDGLVSAIHGLVSGGFSGFSINHSDIGGYTSMSWLNLGYTREHSLLKRWTEMAAFTSLMRTHEGNQPPSNAQVYSDQETREHFARMTRVYRALAFYRDQLFAEATSKGWPVVRHLLMHWPQEEELYDVSDQFLLGSEILVAPIKNKCFTWPFCPFDKAVVLPPGQWVHLWSGEVHGDAQAVSDVTVQAPYGEPAVFYLLDGDVGATFVANLAAEGIDVPSP